MKKSVVGIEEEKANTGCGKDARGNEEEEMVANGSIVEVIQRKREAFCRLL